jgi:hypothetical protein
MYLKTPQFKMQFKLQVIASVLFFVAQTTTTSMATPTFLDPPGPTNFENLIECYGNGCINPGPA